MDRRNFLKAAGIGSIFAETSSPQALAANNRNRSNILSSDLTAWAPSASEWNTHTINHLYRRAGFGATLAEIKAASGKNYSQVVDELLADSLLTQPTVPPLPSYADDTNAPPSWLHVSPAAYGTDFTTEMMHYGNAQMKTRAHWAAQMNQPGTMLREKLLLFWMNHFVIEAKKVMWPQMTYNFLTYFRNNGWGNFKKMVSDVTILPGMLYYLDGVLNAGYSPNENYARELQELFTMGVYFKNDPAQPNYTQDDVHAVAAALTGWVIEYAAPAPNVLPAKYNVNSHNSTFQKIYDGIARQYNLTASGASMDMDLIDHIFTARGDAIAWYICSKLYQFFVYHDITSPDALSVIDAMAAIFKKDWEIKPVVSALLKSAHFFDEANIGSEIKSPYEHLIGLTRSFNIQLDELSGGSIVYYAAGGSQYLFDPPNVKGWPGYHNWISTTTLPERNLISGGLLVSKKLDFFSLRNYADGYGNTIKSVDLPSDNELLASWAKQFSNYSGTFDDMLSELATYLCAQLPTAQALAYVKGQFPPATYEWATLDDATKLNALRLMAAAITQLADFQLT